MARTRTWTAAAAEVERQRTCELAKIGNNLNQIARWANTYKENAEAAEYLTRERFPAQDQEKNPEEIKVLRGNPHQVADIGAQLTALNLQP